MDESPLAQAARLIARAKRAVIFQERLVFRLRALALPTRANENLLHTLVSTLKFLQEQQNRLAYESNARHRVYEASQFTAGAFRRPGRPNPGEEAEAASRPPAQVRVQLLQPSIGEKPVLEAEAGHGPINATDHAAVSSYESRQQCDHRPANANEETDEKQAADQRAASV
jgi:hypothetical protein